MLSLRAPVRLRLIALAAASCVAIAVVPAAVGSPVSGGTYTVVSCPGDDGWSAIDTTLSLGAGQTTTVTSAPATAPNYVDTCTSGTGRMFLEYPTGAAWTTATLEFGLPADLDAWINGWSVSLTAFAHVCATQNHMDCPDSNDVSGEGAVEITGTCAPGGQPFDFTDQGLGTVETTATAQDLNCGSVTSVPIQVFCYTVCTGPGGYPLASVQVNAASFEIETVGAPTASDFSGSLLQSGAQGNASLSFTAADPQGPGVYKVAVLIDGNPVYSGTPNLNGGRCVSVGNDAENGGVEFAWVIPCPQSENVDLTVNTTSLTPGPHQLQVLVSNAAGVSTTALAQTIDIGGGGPSGSQATSTADDYTLALKKPWARLRKAMSRPFDRSELRLSGTLRAHSGFQESGTPVSAWAQPASGGAFSELASTTANASGIWDLTVPKGASRVVCIVAGTGARPTEASEGLTIHERVSPSLTLRIQTPGAGRLVFSGHIYPYSLSASPTLALIEAKGANGWEVVGAPVHPNAQGAFRYAYQSSPITLGRAFDFRATTTATSLWSSGNSPTQVATVR
jgi:hypothetical protein